MSDCLTVGSLCSGYGGLELGLQAAGVQCETVWYSEVDKYASQVMEARFPDAPNLGDLTELVDPPSVDIVTAGFPCQPVSKAGKGLGADDERWLIEDVCRTAKEAKAKWLILENVRGLLTANGGHAMARVVAALASNGFAAEWTCLRASDVGAPHQRARWFAVAYSHSVRTQIPHQREQPAVQIPWCDGEARGNFGVYNAAVRRWEKVIGRIAPDPVCDTGQLNPVFVEWLMGLPAGWVTDVLERRVAALGCLGNGVVPQQAAYAITQLTKNIEADI